MKYANLCHLNLRVNYLLSMTMKIKTHRFLSRYQRNLSSKSHKNVHKIVLSKFHLVT